MSLSKLQILDLPFLAMQNITNLMKPIEILDFSLCSERARKCAMMHRIHATHCNLIMRTTFDKKVCVEIVFSDYIKLSWIFIKEVNKKYICPEEEILARKVSGTFFEKSKRNSATNTIISFGATTGISLQTVTSHILSVFPCPVQTVELDLNFFSDLKFSENWKTIQKCENLKLRACDASRENLEYAMSIVNEFKNLEIIGYEEEELTCHKMLAVDHLKLNSAEWLSKKTFFELDCKKIEIGENGYDCSVFNLFMKRWLQKKYNNLEYLVFNVDHISQFEIHKLFEGIHFEEWNPDAHHRYFRKDAETVYDCKNGLDILRSDGKLATLLYANYCFNFFVWNEKFPDFTPPRGMYYAKNLYHPVLEAKLMSPNVYFSNEQVQMEHVLYVSL